MNQCALVKINSLLKKLHFRDSFGGLINCSLRGIGKVALHIAAGCIILIFTIVHDNKEQNVTARKR